MKLTRKQRAEIRRLSGNRLRTIAEAVGVHIDVVRFVLQSREFREMEERKARMEIRRARKHALVCAAARYRGISRRAALRELRRVGLLSLPQEASHAH